MLYAVVDPDGGVLQIKQPAAPEPPVPFATTQLKVAADEASHYRVAAGSIIAHPLLHAANALECWGPADFDRYQVHQVAEPAIPEGEEMLCCTLSFVDGELTADATHAQPEPPEMVSATAFKISLDAKVSMRADKTRLDDFEDAIGAKGSRIQQLYWGGMATFGRDSQVLIEISVLAGCDEAEFHDHLRAAGKLI